MFLLGALGRVGDDAHRFLLKGGVAMELRLRLRARATKDIDIIVIPDRNADILEVLQDALDEPYLDFAFRLTDSRPIERTPAQRMSVKMTYRGKSWATLQLEASGPEAGSDEAEQIGAFSLTQLGLDGPHEVACQSLRYQIATKLHAVTVAFDADRGSGGAVSVDHLLLPRPERFYAAGGHAATSCLARPSFAGRRWPVEATSSLEAIPRAGIRAEFRRRRCDRGRGAGAGAHRRNRSRSSLDGEAGAELDQRRKLLPAARGPSSFPRRPPWRGRPPGARRVSGTAAAGAGPLAGRDGT